MTMTASSPSSKGSSGIAALPTVPPSDGSTRTAALLRLDRLTKPLGALGRLEPLAAQLCAIQATLHPSITRPHALVFAGDHGAADRGVSAYPKAVTARMVGNFLAGGAAISVLARAHGLELLVIDAGVDATFPPHPQLIGAKVRSGTRDYVREPAMTDEEVDAAFSHALRIVQRAVDAGSNTLVLGEMGIGNTASAALLMHGLTGRVLSDCVGRGTGLDDEGVARKLAILREARARAPEARDPVELLREFGGCEIAMLTGAVIAAAARRCIVVIDGFTVTAAAALAIRLVPEARSYCVFSHRSAEQAHRALLDFLGVEPLLDLGMRLGEGTGAALAIPLLQSAARLFREMATFESAGVSGKDAG